MTIDGPAGVGKSTVAKLLAQRLGVMYLDTGATYFQPYPAATRPGRTRPTLDETGPVAKWFRSRRTFSFVIGHLPLVICHLAQALCTLPK